MFISGTFMTFILTSKTAKDKTRSMITNDQDQQKFDCQRLKRHVLLQRDTTYYSLLECTLIVQRNSHTLPQSLFDLAGIIFKMLS